MKINVKRKCDNWEVYIRTKTDGYIFVGVGRDSALEFAEQLRNRAAGIEAVFADEDLCKNN
jgi:hypothetical protein